MTQIGLELEDGERSVSPRRELSSASTGAPLEGLARLSRAVSAMLACLVERGKVFPFRFVALAQNGAFMRGRVAQGSEGGIDPIWDVEDVPDDDFQLPIHMLWLDSEGSDAVHVQVDKSGTTKFLN